MKWKSMDLSLQRTQYLQLKHHGERHKIWGKLFNKVSTESYGKLTTFTPKNKK